VSKKSPTHYVRSVEATLDRQARWRAFAYGGFALFVRGAARRGLYRDGHPQTPYDVAKARFEAHDCRTP
jgi:hypothetical protein